MAVSSNPAINKNDPISNVIGDSTNNNNVSNSGSFTVSKNFAMDSSDRRLVQTTGIRVDWTREEQALLIELLGKYASDSRLLRYGKIAMQLQKSIRDVAMFCQAMIISQKTKNGNKREYDNGSSRKQKVKRVKIAEQHAKPSSHATKHANGIPHAESSASVHIDDVTSYKDVGGIPRKLLEQNVHALDQLTANLSAREVHNNMDLFWQLRNNIITLQNKLNISGVMDDMLPLPWKLNDVLANLPQ